MIDSMLVLVFPAAMALAAGCDLLTMTIPNRLTIGFAALFPVAALAVGLTPQEAAGHLLAGGAVLAVGFGLFAGGWIGGGDAKFIAATALWFGSDSLFAYVAWLSLLGGGVTLAVVWARSLPLPASLGRIRWLARLHDARQGVPYGVALAAAGLVVYPGTVWVAVFGA